MSDQNESHPNVAPTKNAGAAKTASTAAIGLVALALVKQGVNEYYQLRPLLLVVLILAAVSLIFIAAKKFTPGIVFVSISAAPMTLALIAEVVQGVAPFSFIVHMLMLAAAVVTVVFSAKARAAAQSSGTHAAMTTAAPIGSAAPIGVSDRKWVTALLLSLFFGILGFDRLYVGRTGLAMAKLFTAGGLGVWALVDFILVCVGKMPDVHGRPLQR